jgi:hypothetical protein
MHRGKATECSSQVLTNQSALAGHHSIVLRLGQENVPLFFRKFLHAGSGHLERFPEISGSFEDSGQAHVGRSLLQGYGRFRGLRYDLAVGLERRFGLRLFSQHRAQQGLCESIVIAQALTSVKQGMKILVRQLVRPALTSFYLPPQPLCHGPLPCNRDERAAAAEAIRAANAETDLPGHTF